MADDPRELSPAEWLRRPAFNPLNPVADRAPQPDRLRVLLADEERAVETLTRAWWDGEFGAGSWDRDVAKATQARQIKAMRPVLAALREVANGG